MSEWIGVEVIVDNGEPMRGDLSIETLTERIYSDRATRPDPSWRHIDRAGHFHSWARGDRYPTLDARIRRVPCDGSCGGVCRGEGYDVTEHYCFICGEEVRPGRLDDSGEHVVTVDRTWTVTVEGLAGQAAQGRIVIRPPAPGGELVTVRIIDSEHGVTWFGLAAVGEVEAVFSPAGMSGATTMLRGVGELGDFSVPVSAVA